MADMKYLQSYMLGGQNKKIIMKDLTSDARSIRVSCEARSLKGEHTLSFVLRDPENNSWIGGSPSQKIYSTEWKQLNGYFSLPPGVDAELRVDETVSQAPSSVQIRKLVMTQLKSVSDAKP
jgi:hypothetical protein